VTPKCSAISAELSPANLLEHDRRALVRRQRGQRVAELQDEALVTGQSGDVLIDLRLGDAAVLEASAVRVVRDREEP
jgi:hypothetical protein